jgi:hypothetical protein
VARAVRGTRDHSDDVFYAAELAADPGDETLLAQAVMENRVLLTKDHDIGAPVHREARPIAARCWWTTLALRRPSPSCSRRSLLASGGAGGGAFPRAGIVGVREARA